MGKFVNLDSAPAICTAQRWLGSGRQSAGRGMRLKRRQTPANALNFLRLVLACTVVISHVWNTSVRNTPFTDHVGAFAVAGFFSISGYLIARSRLRLSFGAFLVHRFLRIAPGYWAALVVVAFGIVPLSTLFSGESFPAGDAASWVLNNAAFAQMQLGIGSTLATTVERVHWNAPLWTIGFEIACYLLAAALLTFPWFRTRACALLLLLVTAAHVVLCVKFGGEVVSLTPLRLLSSFLSGMVLLLGSVSWRWWLAVGSAALTVGTLLWGWESFATIGTLPFTYLVLYLGHRLPIRVGRTHDISYGVYVYGWPLQQLMAIAGAGRLGVGVFAAMSLGAVVPFAFASWMLIERPSLRLARRTRDGHAKERAAISKRGPLSMADGLRSIEE